MGAIRVPVQWGGAGSKGRSAAKKRFGRTATDGRGWREALAGRTAAGEAQQLTLSLNVSIVLAASSTRKPIPGRFCRVGIFPGNCPQQA